jgi:phosphatidylserine/phosphatidylglycerophosphate/cardiolipin synthase-like enzyme/uncharacterized membrane protein YdjX (TVP38/TMEM64 family)
MNVVGAVHASLTRPGSIFQPGKTVWTTKRADQAAVIIDAAAYFAAVREAFLAAEHSIVIIGWDIDSRTRLMGETPPTDSLPIEFGAFLRALVRKKPSLTVKLLLWDYSVLYALERELLPAIVFRWRTPQQIELCLDDHLPFAASHHQKIITIDDQLAFSGGLDITVRRWDTPAHTPDDPRRRGPKNESYPPFHDIQMAVSGPAAHALSALARDRWTAATGVKLPFAPAPRNVWPQSLTAQFHHVTVGISRTVAAFENQPAIREIEALLAAMLQRAQRFIYIETQFLTCSRLAHHMADALERVRDLEILIVAPKTHHTWLEHHTMQAGRARFMAFIAQRGFSARVKLVTPRVGSTDVMIHSKIIIVDDTILRVGSSNLCNRSMGTDTECDLTIEAANDAERAAISSIRNILIAEHTGLSTTAVEARLNETGSLLSVAQCHGDRRLDIIQDPPPPDTLSPVEEVADPDEPLLMANGEEYVPPPLRRWWMIAIAILAIGGVITLAWKFTPLAVWADGAKLEVLMTSVQQSPLAAILVVLLYVAAGFIAFPLTLLISVTAMVFGAWPGALYALCGSLASALLTYAVGRTVGVRPLRRILGPQLGRIQRRLKRSNVIGLAILRLLPLAPFSVVNVMAGIFHIPVRRYALGTLVGLLPGILALSLLGDQFMETLSAPTWQKAVVLAIGLGIWIGLGLWLQRFADRHSHSSGNE